MNEPKRYVLDTNALPPMFPTHRHDPAFWEYLGRTVATFGFLEEMLGKAIFAFSGTKPVQEEEAQVACENWINKLELALTDQLWNLIEAYGKAVREHPEAKKEKLVELLDELKEAAKIRNVLCHGSWSPPNSEGASVPFFVNRQLEKFDTAIDARFLLQVQKHVTELICDVINSVTIMGYQFPGSSGPGITIWEPRS